MRRYLLIALVLLAACREKLPEFPEVGEPYAVTSTPHDHFMANYFGINAWSPDGRYLAVLETDINGRVPEEGEAATLALVDLQDGNKLIPIGKTLCWNFQEAAMFHWLPWEDGACIYNDCRDGKFVSVVYNWKTGAERIIPYPVSAVSKDGTKAVSVNYARLRLCRPDYGYAGQGQDPLRDDIWPDSDGLWVVDLRTGEGRLILSVRDAAAQMTQIEDPKGLAYFCHTVLSKNAKKIFFLARTVENLDEQVEKFGHVKAWRTSAFTIDIDGNNLRRCYPDGWEGSHFNWLDDETIAVTARWNAGKCWAHTIFKVGEEDKVRHLAPGLLDWDGHLVFSPNGKFLCSDGYWNSNKERNFVLIRVEDEAVRSLGTYFVPEEYQEQYSRCDLHARWRPDGSQIAFNSVHEGTRQVYISEVKWQ
ncbi:MAG: PD40 domain-containing protein [Bacteroidales bacterium]|nr:PD40 domain-containing protein [Bacteroidales bacterium]